jgi:hypothetical protein
LSTVILARGRVTIAKAIKLLRIYRKDSEPVLGERLHDCATGDFDRGRKCVRFQLGPIEKPRDQFRDAGCLCSVQHSPTTSTGAIHQTNPVSLGAPINADKKMKCRFQMNDPFPNPPLGEAVERGSR